MAIILNDNIKINAGKPNESKYLNITNVPYISTTEANTVISISERHLGLTVLIDTGTSNMEYWWREGVADIDLIEKKFASQQFIGDYITGATNLGFFSGLTGVQRLDLSGFPIMPVDFNGYYYSQYNWYYLGSGDVVKIGTPTYGGPLRRAFVNPTVNASWIYDDNTNGWVLVNTDVTTRVDTSVNVYLYGTQYGESIVDWSSWTSTGTTSVAGSGSLYTGTTVTIGNPIYKDKSNQELHLRTILNETPEFLKVSHDDNFIRFSGVSSVISGQNIGNGEEIFTGITENVMGFRTLTQSGDTTITEKSDGSLVIYSSSDGSANALTGATNVGVGIGIYSGITDRNLQFNTLSGGTNTIVTQSGDTIVIDSTGGGDTFSGDITVSIDVGKSFGKYESGDTIPASGKTANEVIILACFEALDPTVSLSSSGNDVAFGESGKTVNLNFSYIINSLGASVVSASLQYYSSGSWVELTGTTTTPDSFTHNIDDSANRFITGTLQYKYFVVDSAGATGMTTHNVSRQTYAAPTYSPTYNGNILGYETQTIREKGNVNTTIAGGASSNRSLVFITGYTIQRCVDGGVFVTIDTCTGLYTLTPTITSCLDSAASSTATSIGYRIQVGDEYTNNNSGTYTINYRYASYYGYCSSTSISDAQIVALGGQALCSSRVRTIILTAPVSDYTYIVYPESYGYLTSAIMDGASPVLGSFAECHCDCSVTNYYGQAVDYILYKSDDPGAFTANSVAFS